MEMLSRVHAKNLVAWAKNRPKAVVLSADLTSTCEADAFRAAYPDRFFSMGVAEQNMLSFAPASRGRASCPWCTPSRFSSIAAPTTRWP